MVGGLRWAPNNFCCGCFNSKCHQRGRSILAVKMALRQAFRDLISDEGKNAKCSSGNFLSPHGFAFYLRAIKEVIKGYSVLKNSRAEF